MTDYPKNLTPEEATFWMQVYLAFMPRMTELPPTYQELELLGVKYMPTLSPAQAADNAIIELRKRFDSTNFTPLR